jgi:2-iminobutanoate/2-iminopropanoate deaminase
MKQYYDPPDVFTAVNLYTHAIRVGRTLTLAGQAPLHDDGSVVAPGDPEAQCRRVFSDLAKTLQLAGATFDDVTYVRAYVTDRTVLPALYRVAAEVFGDNRPACTPLIIPGCRAEGALVEVELVCHLGEETEQT